MAAFRGHLVSGGFDWLEPSVSKEAVMRKGKLLLLAAVLMGTALLSAAQPADAGRCVPGMCFEVDEYTTCCWSETGCVLECWSW